MPTRGLVDDDVEDPVLDVDAGARHQLIWGRRPADRTRIRSHLRQPDLARLHAVADRIWPIATADDLEAATFALEVHGDGGRTDLQISLPHALLVVEAKRDWLLPTVSRLAVVTREVVDGVSA